MTDAYIFSENQEDIYTIFRNINLEILSQASMQHSEHLKKKKTGKKEKSARQDCPNKVLSKGDLKMSTRKSSELEWTGTLQRPGGSSPQSTNEHSENTGTGANHTAGLVAYADLIPSASCNSTYPKHVEVNIQNTGTQSTEVSTTCQDSRRRTGCGCQHSSTPYSEIRLNQLVKNFDAQFSQHSQLKFLM